MQIAINKNIRPHFAETMIENCMTILQHEEPVEFNQRLKIKTIADLKKDEKGTKHKRLGLSAVSFQRPQEYLNAVRAQKEYESKRLARDFHNEQVNGTMFDACSTEGDIL